MHEPDNVTQVTSEHLASDHAPAGDCYSAGERAWMEYGQQLRGRILDPGLSLMTSARMTPDQITLLSLLAGLAFAPLWYWQYKWLAVGAIALHVLLDGMDGPLARFQHVASPRGSFTDSFCDQLVVSAVTIVLMITEPQLSVVAGSLFLVLYASVLAIALVRSTLRIPYSWLVRPRFFLFLAIPLYLLQVPHAVTVVVRTSNLLLAIKLATGFFKLRRQLPGPK
jgi:phosphatidylglycerophosphate synthase